MSAMYLKTKNSASKPCKMEYSNNSNREMRQLNSHDRINNCRFRQYFFTFFKKRAGFRHMDNMTNLESEALKRKKRLEALRNRQQQDQREQTNEPEEATPLPK